MNGELERFREAQRMLPLLRSCADEIRERRLAVRRLKRGLDPIGVGAAHQSPSVREAELSTQLRELRRVERELDRLGWYCDDDDPLRFYLRGKNGAPDVMWSPNERELVAVDAASRGE